jgi:uncharacterized protein YjbI with pentapeptide repeats
MEQLTIRDTRATLPNLDSAELEDVGTLANRAGLLTGFRLPAAEMRSLEISGQRLATGQVSSLRTARVKAEDLRMDSVDFAGCELSQAAFTRGKWSRVRFTDCKILSGQFTDLTFEDVIFDRCKLGYSAFQAVAAKGPVIFRDCSMEETWFSGCDLSRAAFDGCRMNPASFERTNLKGADLRGNDLSQVRGIPCLARALIEPAQVIQLGHALVDDLELRLPGD